MAEHKDLYRWSRLEAERSGELNAWVESYSENCICARAIERAISDGYGENRLKKDCAKKVLAEFGFDRVNWVLANTICEGDHDGRYSRENKQWAKQFNVPKDDSFKNYNFAVKSHPGLVDVFTNIVRKEWQALGLYESNQCYPENLDYTGKVVAIRPECLKDQYKTAADQLFYAESGNGCRPEALGRKVFGQFLKDGERECFDRSEIQGVVKLELLPAWAQEKLARLSGGENQMKMEEIK